MWVVYREVAGNRWLSVCADRLLGVAGGYWSSITQGVAEILLTIPSGGPAVVVTKPNQLMRIILDKGWLTVNRFGSVSKASVRLRLGF